MRRGFSITTGIENRRRYARLFHLGQSGPGLAASSTAVHQGRSTRGKASTWGKEGSASRRSWCWPKHIPAGVTSEAFVTSMDLFSTCIRLAGAKLPTDRVIDGVDVSPVLLAGSKGRDPRFFYYFNEEIWAVRRGPWKLHRKTVNPGSTAKWGNWPVTEHNPPLLFNVDADPGEKFNAAAEHPEIVSALLSLIDEREAQILPGPPAALIPFGNCCRSLRHVRVARYDSGVLRTPHVLGAGEGIRF